MKKELSYYLEKLQLFLLTACGTLPIPVIIFACSAPERIWFSLLIPAWQFAASCLCLLMPAKIRRPGSLLGVLGFGLIGWALFHTGSSWAVFAAAGIQAVLFLAGLELSFRKSELPPAVYGAFLIIHLIGQFVQLVNRVASGSILGGISWILTAAFLVCALFTFLAWNRNSLANAAIQNQKASRSMYRKNTILVILLFLLTVLLSLIPGLAKIVGKIWTGITALFARFTEYLIRHTPSGSGTPTEPGGTPEAVLPPAEAAELTPFSRIFLKVGVAVLKVAVLVGTVFLAYLLVKKLIHLFLRLVQKVSSPMDDYVDVVSDTRCSDDGTRKQAVPKHRKASRPHPGQTPREQIRFRYLRLMEKHREWAPGSTARETLPKDAAELYERARYSTLSVEEQDAEKFRSRTDKM